MEPAIRYPLGVIGYCNIKIQKAEEDFGRGKSKNTLCTNSMNTGGLEIPDFIGLSSDNS